MVQKKKTKKGKKKPSYPKAMTIRYSEFEETRIINMMKVLNKNTMSKAFLETPNAIETRDDRIEYLERRIKKQNQELEELREIAENWKSFTRTLDSWSKRNE